MKLSDQVLLGLRRLGNKTLITEDCFKRIVEAAVFVLSDNTVSAKTVLDNYDCSKPDLVKETYASLLILLVESSRQCTDASNIIATLENYNVNPARLKIIADLYEANKTKFQLSLKSIGILEPSITDVKWRLDFCIKSSSLEHELRPIYFIQIVTEDVRRKTLTDELKTVRKYSFTCSLQQLQELVAKLRDATRLIQSLAQTKCFAHTMKEHPQWFKYTLRLSISPHRSLSETLKAIYIVISHLVQFIPEDLDFNHFILMLYNISLFKCLEASENVIRLR